MVYTTDEKGNIIFNVSNNLPNFSQRNNEYIDIVTKKPTALVACNVTSMCMGLSYCGYNFPDYDKSLTQPEDELMKFCVESPIVAEYYKAKMPAMYNAWVARSKNSYPPNEVHDILSFATNKFMGCKATYFATNVPIRSIISDIAFAGTPVVTSGIFATFGHIVCIVGFKAKPEFLTKIKETKEITDDYRDLIIEWIIDDPYGDFRNSYKPVLTGNNVPMTAAQFYEMLKPQGDHFVKFAHRFNKPAAVV